MAESGYRVLPITANASLIKNFARESAEGTESAETNENKGIYRSHVRPLPTSVPSQTLCALS
jgi:hypothetical protein